MAFITGVEITPTELKYAIVRPKRRGLSVVKHGREPLSGGATPGAVLSRLKREGSLDLGRIRIALGTQTAHLKVLSFPPMPKRDLERVILHEIEGELEILPDELVYGYEVFHRKKKGDSFRVLVALTGKEGIQALDEDLRRHGIEPELVTLGSTALMEHVRTLSPAAGRADHGAVGVLHLSTHLMVLAIVEEDTVRLVRDVAVGVEAGLLQEPIRTGTDDLPGDFDLDLITRDLDEITKVSQQIRRTLDYDARSHPANPVAKLYLAGDVTRTKEIASILQNDVRVPLEIFDPLASFEVEDESLGAEGPAYALPLALAAAGNPRTVPNLGARPREPRVPAKAWRPAALVWVLAAGATFALQAVTDRLQTQRAAFAELETEKTWLEGQGAELTLPLQILQGFGGWTGSVPEPYLARVCAVLPEEAAVTRVAIARDDEGRLVLRLDGRIRGRLHDDRLATWNDLVSRTKDEASFREVEVDPVLGRSPAIAATLPFGMTITVEGP